MMFSDKVENLQIAWDSTSIGAFKQCPRRYYYSIIKGYRKPKNLAIDFGVRFHEVLEGFFKEKASGTPHVEAARKAVAEALKHGRKLGEGDTKRTLKTFVRAVAWYTEQYKNDPLKTLSPKTVEMSFKFDSSLKNSFGEEIILCGHLDRVAELDGDLWAVDLKTTGRTIGEYYFKDYTPDNQVSLYAIATKIVLNRPAKGVIIDAVQLQVGATNFGRGFVYRSKEQCEDWLAEMPYWLAMAEVSATKNLWAQNDKSCFWCDYKEVCSLPTRNRERFLENNYEVKKWRPLDPR